MTGRIIIIIFCLLACVALPQGAGMAYAQEPEASGDKEADAAKANHPEFEYLQMDPLNLPVITTKGLTQQVSILVSLEVDFGKKEAIDRYKPRLTDAYIQDLYGALGAGFALIHGDVVDVRKIKERLAAVTGKVLGPDHKVNNVLLQVLQQRPM